MEYLSTDTMSLSDKLGIFTGIYEAYARKYPLNNTRIVISGEEQASLFAQYEIVETDMDKAHKVMRTVRRQAGEEVFRQLYIHDADISQNIFQISEKEEKYRELFKHFCHKIAIKERKNLELQRNHLPLRYREYMTEFAK